MNFYFSKKLLVFIQFFNFFSILAFDVEGNNVPISNIDNEKNTEFDGNSENIFLKFFNLLKEDSNIDELLYNFMINKVVRESMTNDEYFASKISFDVLKYSIFLFSDYFKESIDKVKFLNKIAKDSLNEFPTISFLCDIVKENKPLRYNMPISLSYFNNFIDLSVSDIFKIFQMNILYNLSILEFNLIFGGEIKNSCQFFNFLNYCNCKLDGNAHIIKLFNDFDLLINIQYRYDVNKNLAFNLNFLEISLNDINNETLKKRFDCFKKYQNCSCPIDFIKISIEIDLFDRKYGYNNHENAQDIFNNSITMLNLIINQKDNAFDTVFQKKEEKKSENNHNEELPQQKYHFDYYEVFSQKCLFVLANHQNKQRLLHNCKNFKFVKYLLEKRIIYQELPKEIAEKCGVDWLSRLAWSFSFVFDDYLHKDFLTYFKLSCSVFYSQDHNNLILNLLDVKSFFDIDFTPYIEFSHHFLQKFYIKKIFLYSFFINLNLAKESLFSHFTNFVLGIEMGKISFFNFNIKYNFCLTWKNNKTKFMLNFRLL